MPATNRGVFISYRRDDSSGHAGRLYDRLTARLGRDRVFRDIETIEAGENFVDVLRRRVENAGAVIVLIGRRWLDARDPAGARRLDDPKDFVRQEVEMALGHRLPVIPVLVDGAKMPKPEELPETLRELALRNALELNEDTFDFEVAKLAARIEEMLGGAPKRSLTSWIALAAAMAALAAGLLYWKQPPRGPSPETLRAIETARSMEKAADYQGAWDLLAARLAKSPDPALESAREDLAMEWVRDPKKPEVLDLVGPLLAQAMEHSSGARKADLAAHYGWSLNLRRRLGATADPEPVFRQALETDPANPYANVMLGYCLLLRKRDAGLDEANQHFRKALESGRDRATVRRLQLAAIANIWDDQMDAEYLRVLIDMARNKEPLDPSMVSKAHSVYYFAISDAKRRESVAAAAPPAGQVLLLEQLRTLVPEEKRLTIDVWIGRLEEKAGRNQQALEAYRRVPLTPSLIEVLKQEVSGALQRLSK